MIKFQNKKNIAVAMSGGIDSSVAAFLLQKKHQVFGVTMYLGPFHKQAVKRAKIICQRLKIPHYIIDLEKEFRKEIIKPFIKEYCESKTPNPCVWCNQKIKFGYLLKAARNLGADYLATGHYACLRQEIRNSKSETLNKFKNINSKFKNINKKNQNIYQLLKAKYKNRDQSYFLYRLSPEQLKKIIFPLGNMSKRQVEKIAIQNNLCFPNQKESREICFIPDNDYRKFLEKYSSYPPGPIKDLKGNTIGEHQGLPFYTIGQRKGLVSGSKFPLYVVRIDKKENTIILGLEKNLYQKQLIAKNIIWNEITTGSDLAHLPKPQDITVKIRYQHRPAQISKIIFDEVEPHQVKIEFKKAQRAITPGQSMVIYRGEQVLGGGIIV